MLSQIKDEILENEVKEEEDNEAEILAYFENAQKNLLKTLHEYVISM